MSMAEARRVMETNFFGPIRIMKAAIPLFRAQGGGTFINISSTEGTSAVPGLSMYAASKFALEAVSESMFGELAAFGIRTLIVEPGGMRTNFLDSGSTHLAPMSEPYRGGIVEHVQNAVLAQHGKQMLILIAQPSVSLRLWMAPEMDGPRTVSSTCGCRWARRP